MIEDMEDKGILDKARMEGMNQGVWLSVQELAHDGRWTQAAEELVSSCGLTEDECRKLQEESESFNDEMIKFIDNMFGRENMISEGSTISENDTICINIKYHRSKKIMSLIDKLEDLVVKVDTEYQEKMEAVIREIVPGMPEGNVRHAAECMCTDRMGSMMDIDIYILKEEDRPYECHYLKDLLEDRVARIAKMHEDESYTYNMDDNYWCATCGSHSHKKDSKTGYCWYCDTVNWVKEDGKDVGI